MDFRKETILKELESDNEFVKLIYDNNLSSDDISDGFALVLSYKLKKDTCVGCTSLSSCSQNYKGMCPVLKYNNRFILDYVPCKYQEEVNIENDLKKNLVTLCCNLDNINSSDLVRGSESRQELYAEMKNILNSLNNNVPTKGLFVSGPYGCGKSYSIGVLAKSIANMGYKTVFAYYPDLVREIKSSIGNNNLEDYIETLKNCDCLVLDDFGGESSSSFIRDEVLGAVLQFRMENKLLTFITSNLDLHTLHNHLAETRNEVDDLKAGRIEERIKSLMKYVYLSDKSYRN